MKVLGIDIGGTGIKGAPVDVETGELLAERFRIPTPHPALPNAVADVVGQIARHFDYSGPAGVTFPAIVKKGVVYSATNVDESWIGTNAAELFRSHLGGPVTVVNDADAAGIAEMHFGAGRGRAGVVILLTFGTGIGSAIFHDGKLLPNSEFGHLQIHGKDAEKRASEKVREEKGLSWKKWAGRVSDYLACLEGLFSPDLFIIGGGVSNKSEKFLPFLAAKTKVVVEAAQMRNEAGIIGAACLAVHPGGAASRLSL
ncbi:MAG: ROK family protein [Terrimicrobiaceae bacterium]|nr:ROK family protein [Terrimicrobiaceae bacterium]